MRARKVAPQTSPHPVGSPTISGPGVGAIPLRACPGVATRCRVAGQSMGSLLNPAPVTYQAPVELAFAISAGEPPVQERPAPPVHEPPVPVDQVLESFAEPSGISSNPIPPPPVEALAVPSEPLAPTDSAPPPAVPSPTPTQAPPVQPEESAVPREEPAVLLDEPEAPTEPSPAPTIPYAHPLA